LLGCATYAEADPTISPPPARLVYAHRATGSAVEGRRVGYDRSSRARTEDARKTITLGHSGAGCWADYVWIGPREVPTAAGSTDRRRRDTDFDDDQLAA